MNSDWAVTMDAKPDSKPKLRFPMFAHAPLHDVWLGDVTEEGTIRNRGRFTTGVVMGVSKEDGMVPMQAHVIADDISRYKVVRKDWFAYNPMRLNIGSIARWHGDNDVLVSPDYVVFQCPARHVEPSLLPDYLDQFRRSTQWDAFTNEAGDGGVRVRIYFRDISQVRLLLPNSDEQKKIADCLSSLDDLIAAEGDRLAALREYKKGLTQQLFPRPERIENGEKIPAETTPGLRFPEFQDAGDWEWTKLDAVLETITPPKKLLTAEYQTDGKFPIVDQGQEPVAGWTDDAGALVSKGLPVVVFGDHTCVLKLIDFPFAQGADGIKILKTSGKMSVHFLYSALRVAPLSSGKYKRHFSDLKEKSVAHPDIETGEQRAISECLASLDEIIVASEDKIGALKAHKSVLMQQLFPWPTEAGA
jgi:type I restriction enzyme S subunit